MIMRLKDRPVSYRRIEEQLPFDPAGNSLTELRDCLRSFGLSTSIVQARPGLLEVCALPAIAHWEEEKATTGHYVIITGIAKDRVEYIDGTTAGISILSMSEFRKRWSGYLLLTEIPRNSWRFLFYLAVVLGGASIGWGVWHACGAVVRGPLQRWRAARADIK
jgi:ABC-type bacteriocin/lantibiotic exporter with double-glycine peptidase domain